MLIDNVDPITRFHNRFPVRNALLAIATPISAFDAVPQLGAMAHLLAGRRGEEWNETKEEKLLLRVVTRR